MSHPEHHNIQQPLAQLQVPPASSNATARIMAEAAHTQRRKLRLLDPVRKLRAQLYVPNTRYGVMASVFAVFIIIGGVNRLTHTPNASAPELASNQPASTLPFNIQQLPDELLLYDVDFAEDDPLNSAWDV